MPKCLKHWKGPKAEAYNRRWRRNYYKDPSIIPENSHQRYSLKEIEIITDTSRPVKEIAKLLGRSVKAIEGARVKYRNRSENNGTR